jgi:hypothetical protein
MAELYAFEVTVQIRGKGTDWQSEPISHTFYAFDLPTALHLASQLPVAEWFDGDLAG